MATTVCPSCGARQTAQVGRGLCPSCLLGLAFPEPEATDEEAEELSSAPIVAVLDGGPGRTMYLAERPGDRQLLTVEIVSAAAAAPVTAGVFAARVAELRRLSHPGLGAVLGGWVNEDGDYCLASQYIPGAPLERYCAAHRVEAGERVSLFLAACRAMEQAHRAGVLHGRLAAGSIVVTRQAGTDAAGRRRVRPARAPRRFSRVGCCRAWRGPPPSRGGRGRAGCRAPRAPSPTQPPPANSPRCRRSSPRSSSCSRTIPKLVWFDSQPRACGAVRGARFVCGSTRSPHPGCTFFAFGIRRFRSLSGEASPATGRGPGGRQKRYERPDRSRVCVASSS